MIIVNVIIWSNVISFIQSNNIFIENVRLGRQFLTTKRSRRSNSGAFEEIFLSKPNFERECVEEQCNDSELEEIVQYESTKNPRENKDQKSIKTKRQNQLKRQCETLKPCNKLGTASCVNNWNGYNCICKPTFSGQNCTESVCFENNQRFDEVNNRCQNCWDRLNQYMRVRFRHKRDNDKRLRKMSFTEYFNITSKIRVGSINRTSNKCTFQDIDECSKNSSNPCDASSICKNLNYWKFVYLCAKNSKKCISSLKAGSNVNAFGLRSKGYQCFNPCRKSTDNLCLIERQKCVPDRENELGYHCHDVNECQENPNICESIYVKTPLPDKSKAMKCQNFVLEGIIPFNNNNSNDNPEFNYPLGFKCIDIDECSDPKLNNCKIGTRCQNAFPYYQCQEINECAEYPNICGSGFTCFDQLSSENFENDENFLGYQCLDIDECLMGVANCEEDEEYCLNTIGSYQCLKVTTTTSETTTTITTESVRNSTTNNIDRDIFTASETELSSNNIDMCDVNIFGQRCQLGLGIFLKKSSSFLFINKDILAVSLKTFCVVLQNFTSIGGQLERTKIHA